MTHAWWVEMMVLSSYACTLRAEGSHQMRQICLFSIWDLCVCYKIKRNPCIGYKPYPLSRLWGVCYFPKTGCGGHLHPVPWGQLLSSCWPIARKVACSTMTNKLPRGLCGAVWWSRGSGWHWITVLRVEKKVTTMIHINQMVKGWGRGGEGATTD